MTVDYLDAVRALMRRYESLEIGGIRDQQLRRRLDSFARRVGIQDEGELVTALRRNSELREKLTDALTINVTSVFRNAGSWDILRKHFLPGLGKRLRMWSAGASTGAEAYTMAIIAKENGQTAEIIASDIDSRALDKARLGRYSDHEMSEVPLSIRNRYFSNDGKEWVVDPSLRSHIRFKRHDLLAEPVLGTRFDVIACRNVVIYFSREAQLDLHGRLAEALRPGGVLFIGGAERIADPGAIGLEPQQRPFYVRTTEMKAVAL